MQFLLYANLKLPRLVSPGGRTFSALDRTYATQLESGPLATGQATHMKRSPP